MNRKDQTSVQMPLIIIVSLLGLLVLSGVFGGYAMLSDTSGELLGLSATLIDKIPLLNNYLVPGLFIFLVFGLVPIVVIYGLISFNQNKQRYLPKSIYHWSWSSARMVSLILMCWIVVQVIIIGFQHSLQLTFWVCGVVLYGLLSMKGIRQFYHLNNRPRT